MDKQGAVWLLPNVLSLEELPLQDILGVRRGHTRMVALSGSSQVRPNSPEPGADIMQKKRSISWLRPQKRHTPLLSCSETGGVVMSNVNTFFEKSG